ncbi:hypothetical protein N658DRAFT_363377 [Parathielavia hyrcaniae]|uniref:Uncharacterized protein n=1 Tax=Parathielavia hyrcaniae TaxID=113614 RepID=A0AAN6SWF5_9PEZI|nr:hypothetical protein N658DRAFT_363377 [Parathielavia hyrcaniae]
MFRGSCQGFQSGVGVGRGSPRPLQGSARYTREPFGFTEPHPVVKINLQESLSVVWDRDSSHSLTILISLSFRQTTLIRLGFQASFITAAQRQSPIFSTIRTSASIAFLTPATWTLFFSLSPTLDVSMVQNKVSVNVEGTVLDEERVYRPFG